MVVLRLVPKPVLKAVRFGSKGGWSSLSFKKALFDARNLLILSQKIRVLSKMARGRALFAGNRFEFEPMFGDFKEDRPTKIM